MLSSLVALAACTGTPSSSTTRQGLAGDAIALEYAAATTWAEQHELRPDIEHKLDLAIAAGFESADNAVVVAHALVYWSRLVRRHLPDPMHTAVPGLADDPDCKGSVIGDHALIAYAAAIGDGEENVTGATVALQTLARHMACLGESQSAQLATRMTIAYDDVVMALKVNGRGDAVPYFAQAIAQPMMIVQDIERRRGPRAPLANWFATHEDILREGANGLHHPAVWHGLWLHDRKFGRLVGFKAVLAGEEPSESGVDLAALYATLATQRPDDSACSLTEMIQRGRGPDGTYWCRAQACAQLDSPDCHEGMSGDAGESPGGGGMTMPGIATQDVLACVAAQAVQPGKQQMTCVLEATGYVADPYDRLVKQMQEVTLAGVKLGDGCDLSVVVSGAAGDYYGAAEQEARDRYNEEIAALQAELTARIEALKAAQRERDEAYNAGGANTPESQAAQEAVDEAAEAVNQANLTMQEEQDKAAAARDEKLKEIEAERAEDAANQNTTHCAPGARACGNGCGAAAQQAAAFSACFASEANQLDPYRAGCGLECDPSEPTLAAPASAGCLTSLATSTPARIQSRECWSARCATSEANGCCGAGGHVTTGSPALPDLCTQALCDGGAPTLSAGSCGCGAPSSPTGGVMVPVGSHPGGPSWP